VHVPFCRQCGAEFPPGTPLCTRDGSPLAAPTDTDPYAPTSGLLPFAAVVEGSTIPDSAPVSLEDPHGGALEMGVAVGEYRVTDVIGEGGMGVVYGGVHPLIGKKVAIKVLRPEFAARPDVVQRFIAEARAVNAIGSRHIVNIFAFGQLADGRHYYVMDRLAGRSLASFLRALPNRDLAALTPLLEDVLLGLAAAHAAKIIHRDLKPDNIFVVEEQGVRPSAVLLDFGIAKLLASPEIAGPQTRTGAVLGTPYYMAPEQFRQGSVDARADLYAFGIILYEIFAGQVPFAAESYIDLVNKHLSEPPPRPAAFDRLPPRLERLIMNKLLAKSPADRPGSAEMVAQELAAIARGEPSTAERAQTPAPPAPVRARIWPWAVTAGLLAGAGVGAMVAARARSAPAPAYAPVSVGLRAPMPDEVDPTGAPAPAALNLPSTGPAGAAEGAGEGAHPALGSLVIHLRPAASVRVDGQAAGEGTDIRRTGLAAGRHLVEATRPGYAAVSRVITIEAKSPREVTIELAPATRSRPEDRGRSASTEDDSATLNPFAGKRKSP
jgi:serine/threonine-protein kinase